MKNKTAEQISRMAESLTFRECEEVIQEYARWVAQDALNRAAENFLYSNMKDAIRLTKIETP